VASVASMIITNLVGIIIYDDVVLKNSNRNKKFMYDAFLQKNPYINTGYRIKLERGIFSIRTILIIANKYIKSLKTGMSFFDD